MSRHKRIYLLFAGLALVYVFINLVIPPNTDALTRYDLSEAEARALKLTLLLPIVAIWFVAFFGYAQLKGYVESIKKSKDGKALGDVAEGLKILAISLPTLAILSTIITYTQGADSDPTAGGVIIQNYADIVFAVLAFSAIHRGSEGLISTLKNRKSSASKYIFMGIFVMLAAVFCYLTLSNPVRQFPSAETGRAAYYLPDFLLVTTIIIPYVSIWYIALRSASYIQQYRQNVKGKIYQSMLGYLAAGVLFVVISRIAIRFLTSLSTLFVGESLRFILGVVYALLVLIAMGYILIALGAKKLRKIEEV